MLTTVIILCVKLHSAQQMEKYRKVSLSQSFTPSYLKYCFSFLIEADIGTACSVVGDCAISTGSECNAGTSLCACTAANTYSTTYKACVTTDKQFGATCAVASVDTDCAVVSGSSKHVFKLSIIDVT